MTDDLLKLAEHLEAKAEWCRVHHPDCGCSRIFKANAQSIRALSTTNKEG